MSASSLTERDREVLGALAVAKEIRADWKGWLTPMYVGGRDASHHSATLAKLVRRGLAERKERAGFTKSSFLYRITNAGRVVLRALQAPGKGGGA